MAQPVRKPYTPSGLQPSEPGPEDGVGLSLSRQEGVGDEESEEGEELLAGGVYRRLLLVGVEESDSTLLERRRGRADEDDSLLELDSSLR